MRPIFQIQTADKHVLAVADYPQQLDFSKLHHHKEWLVVAVYPATHKLSPERSRIIAAVNWGPAGSYLVRLGNQHSKPVDRITCHSRIMAIVRGALEVWNWEDCFDQPDDNHCIIIMPENN